MLITLMAIMTHMTHTILILARSMRSTPKPITTPTTPNPTSLHIPHMMIMT